MLYIYGLYGDISYILMVQKGLLNRLCCNMPPQVYRDNRMHTRQHNRHKAIGNGTCLYRAIERCSMIRSQPHTVRHLPHPEHCQQGFCATYAATYACLTPRSPSTSSAPPRIASNFCVLWNCSINFPIPVLVRARPPKIWTASSAISPAKRVDCILRKAI